MYRLFLLICMFKIVDDTNLQYKYEAHYTEVIALMKLLIQETRSAHLEYIYTAVKLHIYISILE